MEFKSIEIQHKVYGTLTCRVLEEKDNILTLWCQPLPISVHFDDPGETIRYFYTVGSAIKQKEQFGQAGQVDPSALRYENIRQYGCNQWPLCSLRSFLNNEFLNGLMDADKVLSTKNQLMISKAFAKSADEIEDEEDSITDEQAGYRIIGQKGKNTRITVSITEDKVYLPTHELFEAYGIEHDDRGFEGADGELRFYWLMNPSTSSNDEFSVYMISQYRKDDGKTISTYEGFANANSMNISPSPVFRMVKNGSEWVGDDDKLRTEKYAMEHTKEYIMGVEMEYTKDMLDAGRVEKALDAKCTPANIDLEKRTAVFLGSEGNIHHTTINNCTCQDFTINLGKARPCKHMIRLAMELDIVEHGPLSRDLPYVYANFHLGVLERFVKRGPVMEAIKLVQFARELRTRRGLEAEDSAFAFAGVPNLGESGIVELTKNGRYVIKKEFKKGLTKFETCLANRLGALIVDHLDNEQLLMAITQIDGDGNN